MSFHSRRHSNNFLIEPTNPFLFPRSAISCRNFLFFRNIGKTNGRGSAAGYLFHTTYNGSECILNASNVKLFIIDSLINYEQSIFLVQQLLTFFFEAVQLKKNSRQLVINDNKAVVSLPLTHTHFLKIINNYPAHHQYRFLAVILSV
ncbi:hypothetical protein DICVIV_13372 [Dictyocaulus viviparus]|uniref:Uncharacterized protein n=1 Tax=Dictyocaulus viviparus TaxID=29172 RepID=A0A0D8XAM1_DICVI|nr:hypothetical protein DICVIV_13372 [Dictyocaulus viviparus]